jgi:hypothetical protein
VTARSKKPEGSAAGNGKPIPLLRKTPGRRVHVAERRVRAKRGGGWHGTKTDSQGSGGEDPRGEAQGRTRRSIQDLEVLRPGNEALKRTRSGRVERHQGTAGRQGPGNRYPSSRGKAPKGESRERCGPASCRSARWDREQTVRWVPKPRRRSGEEARGIARKGRAARPSLGSIAPQVLWRRETS